MADNDELNGAGKELETDINELIEQSKSTLVDKIKLDNGTIVDVRDTKTLDLLSRLFNQTLGAKDGLGTGCVAFESRAEYDKIKDKYSDRDKLILIADDHIEIKREDREDWNPIGTILPYMGVTAPDSYLMCDSTIYNANDYPELWKILPDNVKDTTNNTFVIDMCETVLVGAGTSGRPNTELNTHDIYTLGEFKDDQMQQHRHELAVRNYKGGISNGYPYSGLGASNTGIDGTSYSYDGTLGGVKSYMGNIDGRVGTTNGKQIGVNYIIKY